MEKGEVNLISKKRRLDSDDFPNPKDEGMSKAVQSTCRLYFKGLVSNETAANGGERKVTAGFGVAIYCDQTDTLLYETKESLSDGEINRKGVEIKALIRGLSECLDLGIRNVVVYCDDHHIYQFITGRWVPKQSKIVQLVEEVVRLREKLASSETVMVARSEIKFAYKLAREAIDVKAKGEETCEICLEETDTDCIFFIENCLVHRHCFSCVKQHVQVKLLSGVLPTCLHYGCKSELTLENCSNVLTPKLIDMWKQKLKEDSIPADERIYCPYPSCSVLMSKTELGRSDNDKSNVGVCVKCCGLFCIDCKVPSHSDMSCTDYKKLHPDMIKLKSLANDNKWRQCIKCRHLIELSQGCNHMTCRCGYEFCYKCGEEWKKNQQACPFGCLTIDHGDSDYDYDSDDDDDDSSHYCEDVCNCYYDEDNVRWDSFEDYIDHQIYDYDPSLVEEEVVLKDHPSPEQFVIEQGSNDGYDDDGCYNYGGLTESDDEGGFIDYYMDYYSL